MPWISEKRWQYVKNHIAAIHRRLDYIAFKTTEQYMATRATDQAVIAAIRENTSVTAATKLALQHYSDTTAELTQKLADALANADGNADDQEVKDALAALVQNNTDLKAAIPTVAAAVDENT